jgi:hypothetical protein
VLILVCVERRVGSWPAACVVKSFGGSSGGAGGLAASSDQAVLTVICHIFGPSVTKVTMVKMTGLIFTTFTDFRHAQTVPKQIWASRPGCGATDQMFLLRLYPYMSEIRGCPPRHSEFLLALTVICHKYGFPVPALLA